MSDAPDGGRPRANHAPGTPVRAGPDVGAAPVVFRAVPRAGTSSVLTSSPVTVDGRYVHDLLATHGMAPPGTFEPGALRPILQTVLGRARGRNCGQTVALLRLVLVAEVDGMVLRCGDPGDERCR